MAVRLLRQADYLAPHTGEPYSEAMLCGIGYAAVGARHPAGVLSELAGFVDRARSLEVAAVDLLI